MGEGGNATALGRSAYAETFFAVLGCGISFTDSKEGEIISTVQFVQYFLNKKKGTPKQDLTEPRTGKD